MFWPEPEGRVQRRDGRWRWRWGKSHHYCGAFFVVAGAPPGHSLWALENDQEMQPPPTSSTS
eukprot:scaffold199939_cov36-Tisochrysis_lutea.AAC.1